MDLQLQPSISTDQRSQAHLSLINRLGNLDLSPILVYRIPSLTDSAVLAMAWQWDVLNPLLLPALAQIIVEHPVLAQYLSWDAVQNIDTLTDIDTLQYLTLVATTQNPITVGPALYAQYRSLIELSTSLHSIMGTPQALKNALAGVGFPSAIIQEGQNTWGGTQYPPSQGWAVFRVLINLDASPPGTDFTSLPNRMVALCNFWKPARCHLDSVQFQHFLFDTLIPPVSDSLVNIFLRTDLLIPPPTDIITARFAPLKDTKSLSLQYNKRYFYGSDVTYGDGQPHVVSGPVVVNGIPVTTK